VTGARTWEAGTRSQTQSVSLALPEINVKRPASSVNTFRKPNPEMFASEQVPLLDSRSIRTLYRVSNKIDLQGRLFIKVRSEATGHGSAFEQYGVSIMGHPYSAWRPDNSNRDLAFVDPCGGNACGHSLPTLFG
jgi:hypothetical protein